MHLRHKKVSLSLPNLQNDDKYSLIVNSDFDSGNMQSAIVAALPSYQVAFSKTKKHPYGLIVTPALQPFNSVYSNKVSVKTFFHFSVTLKVHSKNKKQQKCNPQQNNYSKGNTKNGYSILQAQIKQAKGEKADLKQANYAYNSQNIFLDQPIRGFFDQQKWYNQNELVIEKLVKNTALLKGTKDLTLQSKKVKIQILINRMKIMQHFQNNSEMSMLNQFYNVCVYKKKIYKGNCNSNSNQRQSCENNYLKQHPQELKISVSQNYDDETQYDLSFNYQLDEDYQIFFAYHFPYSYARNLQFLKSLDSKVQYVNNQKYELNKLVQQNTDHKLDIKDPEIAKGTCQEQQFIYYTKELLTQSLQKRQIHLLTITSVKSKFLIDPNEEDSQLNAIRIKDKFYGLQFQKEKKLDKLFPKSSQRPYAFSDKPYIFISSRVHPGQTSSSFALEGIINMLLLQKPIQMGELEWTSVQLVAKQMLKMFVFVIVPMVNPDGVYHGCYRMDTIGQNLNRFYQNPNPNQQPSIFAIHSYVSQIAHRLLMYIDFHAHPNPNKGAFFYGNSYNSFHLQVQSQQFAKLLNKNCELFSYQNCSFSPQHMNSKDINQLMSKQGCGRVFAFKTFNKNEKIDVPFCYTLQLGYHGMMIPLSKNTSSAKKMDLCNFCKVIFTPESYQKVGRNIIQSLYETFQANCVIFLSSGAQNEIQLKQVKSIASLQDVFSIFLSQQIFSNTLAAKQETAKQIFEREDRFRMTDPQIQKKLKSINGIISKSIYSKIFSTFSQMFISLRKTLLQNANKIVTTETQRLKIAEFLSINNVQKLSSLTQQQQRNILSLFYKKSSKRKDVSSLRQRNQKKNKKCSQKTQELTSKQFRHFKMAFPRIQLEAIKKKEINQQVLQNQSTAAKQHNHSFKLENCSKRSSSRNQQQAFQLNQQKIQHNLNGQFVTNSSPLKTNHLKRSLKKINDKIFSDQIFRCAQFKQQKDRIRNEPGKAIDLMKSKDQIQVYNQILKLDYRFQPNQKKKKTSYSYRDQFTTFKKGKYMKGLSHAYEKTQQKINQRNSMIISRREQYNPQQLRHNRLMRHHTENEQNQDKLTVNAMRYYNQQACQESNQTKIDLKKLLQPFIEKSYETSLLKKPQIQTKYNRNSLSVPKNREDSQSSQSISQVSQMHDKYSGGSGQFTNPLNKLHHNAFYSQKKTNLGEQYCSIVKKSRQNKRQETQEQNNLNYNTQIDNHQHHIRQLNFLKSNNTSKKHKNEYKNANFHRQNASAVTRKVSNLNNIINRINQTQQDLLLPKIQPKKVNAKCKLDDYIQIPKKCMQQHDIDNFQRNYNGKELLNFVKRKVIRNQQSLLRSQRIRQS